MHQQAGTETAAAWSQATEAILEIFPAVVKSIKAVPALLVIDIHSPPQSTDFLSGPATIYAQSSGTVLYFASIRAGSVCLRTPSINLQMRVGT